MRRPVHPLGRRHEDLARTIPHQAYQALDAQRVRPVVDRTRPGFGNLHSLVQSPLAGVMSALPPASFRTSPSRPTWPSSARTVEAPRSALRPSASITCDARSPTGDRGDRLFEVGELKAHLVAHRHAAQTPPRGSGTQ